MHPWRIRKGVLARRPRDLKIRVVKEHHLVARSRLGLGCGRAQREPNPFKHARHGRGILRDRHDVVEQVSRHRVPPSAFPSFGRSHSNMWAKGRAKLVSFCLGCYGEGLGIRALARRGVVAMGLQERFSEHVRGLGLPSSVAADLDSLYLPLLDWVRRKRTEDTFVLGVNGGQGSGKSTLCALVEWLLHEKAGLRVLTVSIDDLYLPREIREVLGETVHPLAAIRGVPGTHDVKLAMDLLGRLSGAHPHEKTPVPRFDKAQDDRLPKGDWDLFEGRPDVILFEGWCVGARPAPAWEGPCNDREAREDPEGTWVTWSNAALGSGYQELFGFLDALWMIRVPSMETVVDGRWQQEERLRATVDLARTKDLAGIMSRAEVEDYVALFERLTLQMLRDMPGRADVVVDRDATFQFTTSLPTP